MIENKNSKEKELINELVAGNEDAYRRLITLYRKHVIRLCMGFTGSSDDAEDLAQDVFVEIFKSIRRFRGQSSLSTWIYRIAVNKSLNFIRDRKRGDYNDYKKVTDLGGNDSGEYSADQKLVQEEHSEALHSAIDSLPEAQRTAFVLSKYEDMKYSEIADVMKTSISSVESLLFRAKKNLQSKLFNYYKRNLK
ncbi:MAG: RNA polymerase sigma factor [Bacteroidota bacterium]